MNFLKFLFWIEININEVKNKYSNIVNMLFSKYTVLS